MKLKEWQKCTANKWDRDCPVHYKYWPCSQHNTVAGML